MSSSSGASAKIVSSSATDGFGTGICHVRVDYVAYDPCLTHVDPSRIYPDIIKRQIVKKRSFPFFGVQTVVSTGVPQCDCPKKEIKRGFHEYDASPVNFSPIRQFGGIQLFTKQWAQFAQVYLLANTSTAVAATSVKNTAAASQTIAASNATSAVNIVAGTTGTAAAFADTALGAQSASTSGTVAATMTAISSNIYTVVGTITNGSGSTIAYNEVGIVVTANAQTYLFCHDAPLTGGPYSVSNLGTLLVTYTHTWT
jgi:hypothetical protein